MKSDCWGTWAISATCCEMYREKAYHKCHKDRLFVDSLAVCPRSEVEPVEDVFLQCVIDSVAASLEGIHDKHVRAERS